MMFSGLLKIRDSLMVGIREIYYHKMRSFLTLLGIMLGVGALVTIMSIMYGYKKNFIDIASSQGGIRRISFYPLHQGQLRELAKKYKVKGVTIDDMKLLEEKHGDIIDIMIPQVTVSPVKVQRRNVTYEFYDWTAIGTTAGYAEVDNWEMDMGRNLTPIDDISRSRVCVIGSIIRLEFFDDYESPLGQELTVNGINFTVIGTFKHHSAERVSIGRKPSEEDQERMAEVDRRLNIRAFSLPKRAVNLKEKKPQINSSGWDLWEKYGHGNRIWHQNLKVIIPYSTFVTLFRDNKKPDSIEILVHDSEKVPEYAELMKQTLLDERNGVQDFDMNPWSEYYETWDEQIKTMTWLFGAITAISLLVGGIGIMNVILASISDRIREIGVRKSVGARNIDIFTQFLIETLMLTTIGGILGSGLGAAGAMIATKFANFQAVIPPHSVPLAVGVASLIGIAFGMYPSIKASRMNPIDALRYE